jgi:hypothetical protein
MTTTESNNDVAMHVDPVLRLTLRPRQGVTW